MADQFADNPDPSRAPSASPELLEQGSDEVRLRGFSVAGRRLNRVVEIALFVAVVLIIAAAAWYTWPDDARRGAPEPTPSYLIAPPVQIVDGPDTWSSSSVPNGYRLTQGVNVIPVDGRDMTLTTPHQGLANGWEQIGNIAISKSTQAPQDAEGIIYWSRLVSDGVDSDGCGQWWQRREAVATPSQAVDYLTRSSAVSVRRGPIHQTIGSLPTHYLELEVRAAPGCSPGYFFGWWQRRVGAFWDHADGGDTLRGWIVDLGDDCLMIWAETHDSSS